MINGGCSLFSYYYLYYRHRELFCLKKIKKPVCMSEITFPLIVLGNHRLIVSKQNSIGFFFDLIFISCQMLWLTTLLLNHTQVFGQSLVENQHNLSKLRYSKQLRSYMKDKDEGELYKFVRRAYYYFRMNTNGICRCLYAVLFKECNVE